MKKIHSGNKHKFFLHVKKGEHFTYSFSTMTSKEVRELATAGGIIIDHVRGTEFKVFGTQADIREYILSLKVGERVVETGRSALLGRFGTVYLSTSCGTPCIRWDKLEGEEGQMGTTVTGGARRL